MIFQLTTHSQPAMAGVGNRAADLQVPADRVCQPGDPGENAVDFGVDERLMACPDGDAEVPAGARPIVLVPGAYRYYQAASRSWTARHVYSFWMGSMHGNVALEIHQKGIAV